MSDPNQVAPADDGEQPTGQPPVPPTAPAPPASGWGAGGYGPTPGYGQPGYGAPPQGGQPEYGAPQYGNTPTYGPPQDGQPQFGQPQYGAPQYGAPQYGAPQYGAPQYGQPQYGGAQYGGGTYGPGGAYQPPAVQRGIVPLRPLNLGELLDGAFRAIRDNPRVMFGVSAIVVTVTVLLQTLVQWYAFAPLSDFMSAPQDIPVEDAFGDVAGIGWGLLLSVVLTGVATTMLTGLLIVSVSRSVIGQRVPLGEAWDQAKGQVPRLLVMTVLVFLGMALVPTLWIGGLIAAIAADEVSLAVLVGLGGALATVVWSAWFWTRTLLATPSLMLEDQHLMPAFRRGWALSKGSFWRLLGVYLLVTIMVMIVASLVTGPASVLAGLLAQDPASPLYLAATALSTIVASILTTPFTAAVVALLYIDTRMRREGLDVELGRAAEAAAQGTGAARA